MKVQCLIFETINGIQIAFTDELDMTPDEDLPNVMLFLPEFVLQSCFFPFPTWFERRIAP
ncbi:hypothetical protein ACIFOT_18490 [Neobacillus sp. NRS-1170]|uniref:hypothetical protein n=1 Tax=Neobacillus sp. NRS-1170 TaxID=3233898 RepID=UPI003D2DCA02